MKTTSVNSASFISNVSTDKTAKQGNVEQNGSSFSSIIGNISVTNQSTVTNLQSSKSTGTTQSKDDSKTAEPSSTIDTSENSKIDESSNAKVLQADVSEESKVKTFDTVTDENEILTTDVLEEATQKVKQILLDVLNISEEDLENAMQTLGLGYLDCLDKNNLAQLLTQVNGNNDISALITNETLYQHLNDITTLVGAVKEDILANLGITEEELMTAIKQVSTSVQPESVNLDITEVRAQNTVASETVVATENAKANVITDAKKNEVQNTINQDDASNENSSEIVDSAVNNVKAATKSTQNNGEQHASDEEGILTKQQDNSKQSDTVSSNHQEFNLTGQKAQNIVNDNQLNVVTVAEKTSVDVENVIKQIQNQIKLTASADTTTMEFQLNPEHLGKLTIQIASKDGTITAQITAQNYAVKEVIESQIVQLKENMNNQGLKVDAVEVAVESHEFERNLDEGNSKQGQEQFEQQEKNGRRQLNYNSLETLEDLTEEETLIAQMMIGNGNSVNYTA